MMVSRRQYLRAVSVIAMSALLVPPPGVVMAEAPRSAAGAKAAARAGDTLAWPRTISDGAQDITVYQPQIDSWQGNVLEARAAVAVRRPGSEAPTLGGFHGDGFHGGFRR